MCEDLKERNHEVLNGLLARYTIDKTIRDLTQCESVFVSVEYMSKDRVEFKRAILYANIKYIVVNNRIVKTNKKEILYNFGKKMIKNLSLEEIEEVIAELGVIAEMAKQLILISKIETCEGKMKENYSDYMLWGE